MLPEITKSPIVSQSLDEGIDPAPSAAPHLPLPRTAPLVQSPPPTAGRMAARVILRYRLALASVSLAAYVSLVALALAAAEYFSLGFAEWLTTSLLLGVVLLGVNLAFNGGVEIPRR
jgi:hypothetical protein